MEIPWICIGLIHKKPCFPPGEGKLPIFILSHDFFEVLAFPYLFLEGKFGYTMDRQVKRTILVIIF